MKRNIKIHTKTFKFFILLVFATLLSCSNDDNDNKPSGTFLTINGETKSITANGDKELRITKRVSTSFSESWFFSGTRGWDDLDQSFVVIKLQIYDPNNSIIGNFGNLNIKDNLEIRFAVPRNFTTGTYETKDTKQSYSLLFALGSFTKISDGGKSFTISENDNQWILEFDNIVYESSTEVSGRIILNK